MTEMLEIAADHGWIKLVKKCDEYIEYARKVNSIECAAWLIDYKKRAFDLEKEREKAEKKAERELNAAPDSVTALKGLCKNLTRVELPNSIEKIGRSAFLQCAALKELVIPEGVREIGETAFSNCEALEKIVLPDSLKKAKNYTQKGIEPRTIFYNSPNVTAVVTPKSYAEKYCKRNNIPYTYKED